MARANTSWWSKAWQNKLIVIVLAMMIIVPFIATPFDGRHAGFAALACEGFGIALLVSLMWRKKPDLSRESIVSFLKTGSNIPALLFLVIVGASLASSKHFHYSVQEALRLASGVLVYFVVSNHFRRSEHITKAVDLLVYISIGVSVIAFAQYGATSSITSYATGLFGDHQLLGSFLMILLPFVAVAAITEKSPNKQLTAQIATVLSIVALLISQARSAWIGTAAGVLVLASVTLWIASRRNRLMHSKHEVVMPLMLIAVSLGFFCMLSPEVGNIGDRIQSMGDRHGSAVQYRAQLASGAMKMIRDRPWTGQGVGLYSLYQARYTDSGMKVWELHDKAGNFARPGMGEMAHNLYLQTAAELGIPGAIAFMCIPLFFIAGGLRKVTHMDAGVRRSVLLAAIASTVAFCIDAAGSPSWQYGQISLFFWLTLGLGVGSLRPRHKHYSAARELAELAAPARNTPLLGIMRGASVVIGLALVVVMVPSIIYAQPPSYLIPRSADIEPKGPVIFSFQSQAFTLTVTFTDNSIYDVTLDAPETVFSLTTSAQGSLGGPNNSVYQAGIGPESVGIKGSFTQNAITVSDQTTLFVVRGG